MPFLFLLAYFSTSHVAFAEMPCEGQSGGWKAVCLQDKAEQADEEATRAYWELQTQIKKLQSQGRSKNYAQQLSSLVRKNELDFIQYSDSYCNVESVLLEVDTEIDKSLKCLIKTSELRKSEIHYIIDVIAENLKARK